MLNCSELDFDGGDCLFEVGSCPGDKIPMCPAPPGSDPGTGAVITSRCADKKWLGDGFCDVEIIGGRGLNCSATNYDEGDCLVDSAGCLGHRIEGCDGSCIRAQQVGDAYCDDCTVAMVLDGYCEQATTSRFNCSQLAFDGGDCLSDPLTGCWGGHRPDCNGICAPVKFIGDGQCDVVFEGFRFNCSATGWDGGDCMPMMD
jgi:hypothetical protein